MNLILNKVFSQFSSYHNGRILLESSSNVLEHLEFIKNRIFNEVQAITEDCDEVTITISVTNTMNERS